MPQDEQIAESSPAVENFPGELELTDVSKLSDSERTEWLKTGKVVAKKAAPPAEPAVEGDEPEDEIAPEPGPGKQPQGKKGLEPRKAQLASEIQELESLLEKRAQLRRELEGKPGDKPADPPPAAKKLEAPKEPDPADYEDWAKYQADQKAWVKAYAAYEAKKAVEDDRADRQRTEQENRVKENNERIEESWKKRVDAARIKHKDFESMAFAKDLPIQAGGVVDVFILESEAGAEVLYHLGSHREELERLSKLTPMRQAIELGKLEDKLTGTEPAPVIKKPAGTPPPTELGHGATGSSDDPIALATKYRNNPRAYMDEMNRRERAAKGQR